MYVSMAPIRFWLSLISEQVCLSATLAWLVLSLYFVIDPFLSSVDLGLACVMCTLWWTLNLLMNKYIYIYMYVCACVDIFIYYIPAEGVVYMYMICRCI